MNQLDRIEAKLNRLLEIAEVLLANSSGKLPGAMEAETAKTLQAHQKELAPEARPFPKTENRVIDREQNIQELFLQYPSFKEDFFKLDEELAGLKGPAGMGMLKEATVGMIARSLRIDVDGFVDKVNEVLAGY